MTMDRIVTAQNFLGAKIPERDPMQLMKALQAGLPPTALNRFKRAAGLASSSAFSKSISFAVAPSAFAHRLRSAMSIG